MLFSTFPYFRADLPPGGQHLLDYATRCLVYEYANELKQAALATAHGTRLPATRHPT